MMSSQSTTILSHLLAVLSLHVHEVGWVQAAVHALLVPGDPTLHGDAAWSRAEDELLQIGHVDQRAVWRGGPWGHDLLGRGTHGHMSHSAGIGDYVVSILRLVVTHWNVFAAGSRLGPGGVGVRRQGPCPLFLRVLLVFAGFVEVHAATEAWWGRGGRLKVFTVFKTEEGQLVPEVQIPNYKRLYVISSWRVSLLLVQNCPSGVFLNVLVRTFLKNGLLDFCISLKGFSSTRRKLTSNPKQEKNGRNKWIQPSHLQRSFYQTEQHDNSVCSSNQHFTSLYWSCTCHSGWIVLLVSFWV